jgi:ankyrin repeat protein
MDDEKTILKAAKAGDIAAVRKALAASPGLIRARDKDGSTPLHCAAWKGHAEVVRVLLDAGAGINDHNKNDHWGTTPLHAAAHGNQFQAAEVLISRGADVRAKNLHGRTPLEETAVHNASKVAKLLAGPIAGKPKPRAKGPE